MQDLLFRALPLKCLILYVSSGPCDAECNENGCEGPGPHHCINCLHYFLKFKNNTRSDFLLISSLISSLKQCTTKETPLSHLSALTTSVSVFVLTNAAPSLHARSATAAPSHKFETYITSSAAYFMSARLSWCF